MSAQCIIRLSSKIELIIFSLYSLQKFSYISALKSSLKFIMLQTLCIFGYFRILTNNRIKVHRDAVCGEDPSKKHIT